MRGGTVSQPAVELYATQEKANAAAKLAASAAFGADFAVRRMTLAGWVAELWELWGDGRVLVSPLQRTVLVARMLESQRDLVPSSGAARQLGAFFRRYASLLQDESAWKRAEVSPHERMVLEMGRAYGNELAARGLIEPDAAAAWLAEAAAAGEVPAGAVEAVDAVEPTPGAAALLGAFAAVGTMEAAPVAIPALDENVEPRFLLPSGPAAVPAMVRDFLLAAREAGLGSALVCGSNAPCLAEALIPVLAAEGFVCSQRIEKPVMRSFVSRLWCALDNVRQGHHVTASATDAASNPLVALAPSNVRELNRRLRRDRTLTPGDVELQLREASCLMASVLDALSALDDGAFASLPCAAEALEQAVRNAALLTPLQNRLELSVIDSLSETVRQVAALDGPPALVPELWLQGFMRAEAVAVGSAEAAAFTVEFASPYRLNSLTEHSYDAVLLSDVSSEAFCARAGSTALDELAERLSWSLPTSPFDRQRDRFTAAQKAARGQFACLVPLRTSGGEEAYPAFLLKEYVEALRASRAERARATGDVDGARDWEEVSGPLELPRALEGSVGVRGEDDLVETVGATFAPIVRKEQLVGVVRGTLAHLPLTRFMRHAQDGSGRLVLSPSAIEAYLACPYAWFIQRRINPQTLDEGFGPLEEGSFVHAVLAAFYEALADTGRRRVGEGPWPDDERILAQVFKDQIAKERQREAGSGRFVATTSAEGLRLRQLYRMLVASLRRQGRFAPGYVSWAHEYAIGPADGVDYAGVRLNGRVDRIDVNEQAGRFVVIDYKGSASADYNLGFKADEEPVLPKRVQALVYAQALRKKLETLHCAGALYLGYRAGKDKDVLAGAADETLFDGVLVGAPNVSPLNFDALLDFVEERVAEGMAGIYDSRIPQHARFGSVCRYCPVPDCAGRLA